MNYFPNIAQVPEKEVAPGVKIQVAWGEKIMLSRVSFEPGAVAPLHSHPHEQAGIVLEGEFDFTIGNETKRLKPGDVYFVPGGVLHAAVACNGRAVSLDAFYPPREEYQKAAEFQLSWLSPKKG